MPRSNETRHRKYHQTCTRRCRLEASVWNNKQRWNNGKKTSFKYFIRYRNETDRFSGPLYIRPPKMNGHVKYFDNNNKFINLFSSWWRTAKKYNKPWKENKDLIKGEFDSNPANNNK